MRLLLLRYLLEGLGDRLDRSMLQTRPSLCERRVHNEDLNGQSERLAPAQEHVANPWPSFFVESVSLPTPPGARRAP